ncbi:retrovirus-related Pol polyprotein from transposon opus [Trichonephila clavipes]|uniref:Retrovirus-related Pol polyprotein from transposon opus n=1 Tax=Trichonephila clavipes TaxID=2585209 RepID=A0A8X7BG03_TRICX|nr:retrovirus-related Pol polyprotein from transposon opus [Trichonephila clavipes]
MTSEHPTDMEFAHSASLPSTRSTTPNLTNCERLQIVEMDLRKFSILHRMFRTQSTPLLPSFKIMTRNLVEPGWGGGSHSGAQRNSNPEFRIKSSFRIIPEQYFSWVENVIEFLENIDNNLTYYEIPAQLACAYLKGHLTGWALDWFEVLGYTVVEEKTPDYAHLKQALTEQFNLFTDASGVGIGTVLHQNHRPVAFTSRTLNKAERNYTVTERECLVVIWALNKFRTCFGVLPVKVITDHAALTKLTNGKNLSSRMIRWALKLSEFNIEWEHRPGAQNVVADVLSRNPVNNLEASQISCAVFRVLALSSSEQ